MTAKDLRLRLRAGRVAALMHLEVRRVFWHLSRFILSEIRRLRFFDFFLISFSRARARRTVKTKLGP